MYLERAVDCTARRSRKSGGTVRHCRRRQLVSNRAGLTPSSKASHCTAACVCTKNRDGIERLGRYGARGPLTLGRLCHDGVDVYRYLMKRTVGGRDELVMTGKELVRKLAVLVPPPRCTCCASTAFSRRMPSTALRWYRNKEKKTPAWATFGTSSWESPCATLREVEPRCRGVGAPRSAAAHRWQTQFMSRSIVQ